MKCDREKLRKILLSRVAPYMIRELDAQACLSISTLVAEVLREFGLKAEARTCQVTFANEQFIERYRRDPAGLQADLAEKKLPGDVWSVGIGYDAPGDVHPLHAVVFLPDEEAIVDLTAGQANRPEKKLFVGPYWADPQNPEPTMLHFKFVEQRSDPILKKLSPDAVESMKATLRTMIGKAFTKEDPHDGG